MANPPSVDRLPKRWSPDHDDSDAWERIRADPRWRAIWRTLLTPRTVIETDGMPVDEDTDGKDDAMG